MFKVDFEKAYDTMSQDFLIYMMKKMGFGSLWMRWTEACVITNHMSILVNGSPTRDFMVGIGLRQKYLLSPFLFVMIVEGLSILVRKA